MQEYERLRAEIHELKREAEQKGFAGSINEQRTVLNEPAFHLTEREKGL